jgi:hypothetical protein
MFIYDNTQENTMRFMLRIRKTNGLGRTFFYWWNFYLKNAKFGPKTHFLITKILSILTLFHPVEKIFISLWWFHQISGRKCCTFCFTGATCSIYAQFMLDLWRITRETLTRCTDGITWKRWRLKETSMCGFPRN